MFKHRFRPMSIPEGVDKPLVMTARFLANIFGRGDPDGTRGELADQLEIQNRSERELFMAGVFRIEHFALYLNNGLRDDGGMPIHYIDRAWQKLLYFGVIESARIAGIPWSPYVVPNRESLQFTKLGCIVYGPDYLISEASNRIFQIEVRDKNTTDLDSGTCFLVVVKKNGKRYGFFVTNKHVIDPDRLEIVSIRNAVSSFPIDKIRSIHCDDKHDLAALFLGWGIPDEYSGLSITPSNAEILTEIITIGYPGVAGTEKTDLLVHSGEVNGYIKYYRNGAKAMIISADVAPGNSGCPVLNELGEVVGVVSEDPTEKRRGYSFYGEEPATMVSVHHAAVPAVQLILLLNSILDDLDNEGC